MKKIRSLVIGLAAAMFIWTVAPALAGPRGGSPGGHGFGPPGGSPGGAPAGEHPATGQDAVHGRSDNPHSNKGGKCRGLTRAEQVASTQGNNNGLKTAAEHAADEAQEACSE